MTSKRDLRVEFRRHLNDRQRDPDLSENLSQRLSKLFAVGKFPRGLWAGFQPTDSEPDIRMAMLMLESAGIEWCFPRVSENKMDFYTPADPAIFSENKWGILEPDLNSSRLIGPHDLRGLLVPGLAFDHHGQRLGRGGGFYDRALHEIQKQNLSTIKVGIGFDVQISEKDLPVEEFDIPMNWIVTESRTLKGTAS